MQSLSVSSSMVCLPIESSDQALHVLGYRCMPGHRPARYGVHKPELLCMQGLSVEIRHARFVRAPPVYGIADDRVPDRCEMHAYLMRPTGLEPALEQRRVGVALDDA